jgi:6,7-dimethyl-8-ribityllumazine synthase
MATANKNLSHYDKSRLKSAFSFRIALVVAEWNDEITHNLAQGAYDTLIDLGAQPQNLLWLDVPGSVELTYGSRKAAELGVDAIIAIGCVIKGETMHFEYVCQSVFHGITELNLQLPIPVIACVLTDNTREQSIARSGGALGNKGIEAAVTAIKMLDLKPR